MNYLMLTPLVPDLSEPAALADEAWKFPDDDLETHITRVSGGELTRLDSPPAKPNPDRTSQSTARLGYSRTVSP